MTDYNQAVEAAETLLNYLTYDAERDAIHSDRTPERMVKGLMELFQQEPEDATGLTVFESNVDEMVVVQDIDFVTLCAHHVLPFHGKCHVAYIPNGKVIGLSKIPRVVRYHSKGLNVQEELTHQIAQYLQIYLQPLGVAVVMSAEHMCMAIRGVKAAGAVTTTSAMTGVFRDDDNNARSEFLQLIRRQ